MSLFAKTEFATAVDITPDQLYPVIQDHGKLFTIRDDAGFKITCGWEWCAHLGYGKGEWQRVEVKSEEEQEA